ncbi:hypothetical protein B484DRAFT_87313 [Ochromonadaceae sp. CCMP2298]|nr:hypothetical protein B484DRAFT_87313 [Ochromonadaceae sp. CCMP2298]
MVIPAQGDALYLELVGYHSSQGEGGAAYSVLVRGLLRVPGSYTLWNTFVEHVGRTQGLELAFPGSPQSPHSPQSPQSPQTGSTGAPGASAGSDVTDVTDVTAQLVLYGLSLFPRCPGLLYLQTLHYLRGGDRCAGEFLTMARAAVPLAGGRMGETLGTLDGLVSSLMGGRGQEQGQGQGACLQLHSHDIHAYQQLHDSINALHTSPSTSPSTPPSTSSTPPTWDTVWNSSIEYQHPNTLVPHAIMHHPRPDNAGVGVTAGGESSVGAGAGADTGFAAPPTPPYAYPSLQVGCSEWRNCVLPGFLIADAVLDVSTHFQALAYSLPTIGTSSVGLLYSSHTLEHLSHALPPPACPTYPRRSPSPDCQPELKTALLEYRRVLVPGGRLLVGVPDLPALAHMLLDPAITEEKASVLLKVIYGGQRNKYDVHMTGFFFHSLKTLLEGAGFCRITRVKEFGLFRDASAMTFFFGRSISLNVQAFSCE